MKSFHSFLVALAVLAIPTGCRKQTVVEEVTVAESGIEVTPRDRTDLPMQWPQWRGPSGDGVVSIESETALPTSWSESENIKWQSPIPGRGHSSPIVVGELVVIATAMNDNEQQLVIAYDRESGNSRWQTVVHEGNFPSNREIHAKATNANATVASDGKVFVTTFFNRGRIIATALDMNGEQIWQTDLGAFASKFGYAPSPLIYQSLVIIAADNGGGGYLVGLDVDSGEIAWRRDRGPFDSYSSPHIANLGGNDQLLITGNGLMVSYDPASGEPRWETSCISDATCGTVVTSGDKIFASGGYPDKETVCLSAVGKKLWSDRTKIYEPSTITNGEHLFAVSDDGIAMCWAVADGELMWKKRLGGNFSSSPILVGDRIYVSDLSGNTYVFQANGDDYEQISKNQVGSDCYASPAVADGSLFYRVGFGDGEQRTEKLICISQGSET